MDHSITLSIPADDDGFVTMQCSSCSERFKLTVDDIESEEYSEYYCVACGLPDKFTNYLSDEAVEAVDRVVENMITDVINDFGKGLEKAFSGSKNISVKKGKALKKGASKDLFELSDMEKVNFSCCDKEAKAKPAIAHGMVYCPFCGVGEAS